MIKPWDFRKFCQLRAFDIDKSLLKRYSSTCVEQLSVHECRLSSVGRAPPW